MEGSEKRAREAARSDGLLLDSYRRPDEFYSLKYSMLEERLEQVREIDGELAYEKMRRTVEKASQEKASSPWWKYLNLTGNGFRSTTSERGLHPEFSQKGSPNLADQLFGGVNEAEHQQHGAKNLGLEAPGESRHRLASASASPD